MDLDLSHPAISDLRDRARRRLPHFVWEYLDSATGDQSSRNRSEEALDSVVLRPAILAGAPERDTATRLLGHEYALPVGLAPVGMSGLVWPDAERHLARLAAEQGLPFCLSNVAAETPEDIGPETGGRGWFQLYPPGDPEIRRDLMRRAKDAGFHTLILTADVPVASRRERQRRARLSNPMKVTAPILAQIVQKPAWALGMARMGMPRLKTLEPYAKGGAGGARPSTEHIGYLLRCAPDWDYLRAVRDEWDGPLVVKGVLDPEAAQRLAGLADAVWVSNHGGRQFEAAPAPAAILPAIREAVGPDMPVIADGSIRSGTDILRLMARGADFVMIGRAVHYGLAAFGPAGAAHAIHVLREGLLADMGQMGLATPSQSRGREMPLPAPTGIGRRAAE
ncbi:alpha-hydroxy acid oxidase [Tranquillimonas rosea]